MTIPNGHSLAPTVVDERNEEGEGDETHSGASIENRPVNQERKAAKARRGADFERWGTWSVGLLLTVGSFLMGTFLMLRGTTLVANLAPVEFIAVLIIGAVLIVFGSGLAAYTYKKQQDKISQEKRAYRERWTARVIAADGEQAGAQRAANRERPKHEGAMEEEELDQRIAAVIDKRMHTIIQDMWEKASERLCP